jgi:hypothetical protein
MSNYLFVFRTAADSAGAADQDAWSAWFKGFQDSIVDWGNRVGTSAVVPGDKPSVDELGGYIVVTAESLDAAKDLAKGCPGLASGGRVEIGEIVPS